MPFKTAMGVHALQLARARKGRSDEIDRELAEHGRTFERNAKVLVLGSAGSGKTTILKQMKIVHQNGFSDAELAEYRPAIYKNVLDSAHQLITYMEEIGLECGKLSNKPLAEKILDYQPDSTNLVIALTPEIADAIHQLWKDPTITKIMDKHSSEFYLMESAPYFFSEVLRIGTPGYLPTETDVLRSKQKRMDIVEMRFPMGQLLISMFDVSSLRGQRKKWIHCFEGVTSLIFCVALSEYDQVWLQEESQNRMLETLALFESVVNSRWFLRTPIFLFLTKMDVLRNKLPKAPLEDHFPEYTGGSDVSKAAKYILWKFMQMNRARLSVYPHLIQATDTTNIRLVFAAVKETILQCALKDSGVL